MPPEVEPAPGARPARPRRLRDALRRPRGTLTIAMIAVVVAVALLATVPISHTDRFSFRGSNFGLPPGYFDAHYYQSLCPAGAQVAVAFSSAGLDVTFGIIAPNYTWVWSQHSAYANVSFDVPACGLYLFLANGTGYGSYAIDGTLTYLSPWW